jgi:hypothetical protein
MPKRDSLKVPEAMQSLYGEITSISDSFCKEHLNEEYTELARKMTATLARKRPSPLVSGRAVSWAAGIIYAIAQVNFLFDKSQSPHMRADELCKQIGVSQQTASGRAQKIRDMLNISLLDFHWTLPSRMDDHPMIWILNVNGFMVDIRSMPRSAQVAAYEKGLIPYVPADRGGTRNEKQDDDEDDDPYWEIVMDLWEDILKCYQKHADQKPVMLYDIQENRIYTYAYPGFKNELMPKSRIHLAEQYQKAVKNNQIVVFVRDNENRELVSYSMDIPT